jgi:hypothetical protein
MDRQLKDEIESLKNRLNELEKRLNNQKPLTINDATVGDVMDGRWIVGHKEEKTAILVSPRYYQKKLKWVDIEDAADSYPDLFIPSKEIFGLVFNNLCKADKISEVFESYMHYWASDSTVVKPNRVYQNIVTVSGGCIGSYEFTAQEAYARPFKLVCF